MVARVAGPGAAYADGLLRRSCGGRRRRLARGPCGGASVVGAPSRRARRGCGGSKSMMRGASSRRSRLKTKASPARPPPPRHGPSRAASVRIRGGVLPGREPATSAVTAGPPGPTPTKGADRLARRPRGAARDDAGADLDVAASPGRREAGIADTTPSRASTIAPDAERRFGRRRRAACRGRTSERSGVRPSSGSSAGMERRGGRRASPQRAAAAAGAARDAAARLSRRTSSACPMAADDIAERPRASPGATGEVVALGRIGRDLAARTRRAPRRAPRAAAGDRRASRRRRRRRRLVPSARPDDRERGPRPRRTTARRPGSARRPATARPPRAGRRAPRSPATASTRSPARRRGHPRSPPRAHSGPTAAAGAARTRSRGPRRCARGRSAASCVLERDQTALLVVARRPARRRAGASSRAARPPPARRASARPGRARAGSPRRTARARTGASPAVAA